MKKLNHTLNYHDLYVEGFALCLMILAFSISWMFIIFGLYLYWQRKTIRWTWLSILMIGVTARFIVFSLHQDTTWIHDQVKVVDVDHYDTVNRITITYQEHQYHAYIYDLNINMGDWVFIKGKVEPYIEETIPYGFNQKQYYLSKNILGKVQIESIEKVSKGLSFWFLRQKLLDSIQDRPPIILSLIFGKDQLDEEARDVLSESNLLFLMQTTGLHVYVLSLILKKGMFYFNIEPCYQTIVILVLYGMIGYLNRYQMGVSRLFLAQIFIVLNQHYKWRFTPLDRIFIIGFLMIITSFHLVYSVGFLMTFIMLLTLELSRDRYQHYRDYLKRLIMGLLIFFACLPFNQVIHPLMLMSLPIIIFYVTCFMYPIAYLTLFSHQTSHVIELLNQGFFHIVAWLNQSPLIIYLPALNTWQMLLYYGLFAFLLMGYNMYQLLIRLILMSSLFGYQVVSHRFRQEASVFFLDVGQGDSSYIETKTCSVMIDTFTGSHDFLVDRGIYTLDYLFLTHSDRDHTLEANDIINDIHVKHVVINPYDRGYDVYGLNIIKAKANTSLTCGNVTFDIMSPHKDYQLSNDNSLVIKVVIEKDIYLFTGDISEVVENELVSIYGNHLKSDILKVAHHGSSTSTSLAFLQNVLPSKAVISVGRQNRFDFPNEVVIKRLIKERVMIYQTDQSGTIIMRYQHNQKLWETTLPISPDF